MKPWTLPFLIRHSAFHTLDHAWEMEDKDLLDRMTRYVVLLRGINVGGRNKVSMAALRDLLDSHGHTNVSPRTSPAAT